MTKLATSKMQVRATRKSNVWVATAAMLLLLALSHGWSTYPLFLLTQVLIFGIAAMGLNLLVGYTGQVSLGHSAFFALGAYGVAVLCSHVGMPYYVSIPASTILCYLLGYLFGFPALRLPMLYLALSTFAIAVVTPQALKWKQIAWLTGGVQGVVLDKPTFPFVAVEKTEWGILAVTLLLALFAFLIARRTLSSQFGRVIDAVRDQPLAAEAGGINVTLVKTQMFGMSAAYTSLAGGLGAMSSQFVSPESYPFFLSVSLLVASLVGGVRSLLGAFVGAAFIVFVPNMAESLSQSAPSLIFGLALVAVVFVAPQGIAGAVKSLWQRHSLSRRV
ncbi:MAG: branched-chain amino acid ABC transporter permease [Rhodoferax sp.]